MRAVLSIPQATLPTRSTDRKRVMRQEAAAKPEPDSQLPRQQSPQAQSVDLTIRELSQMVKD